MNSIATRATGARSRDRLKPATATLDVIADWSTEERTRE
jgi:hypothetical protein